MESPVLILDNGANTIKAGFSTSNTDEAKIIQNAIVRSKGDRRMYIGPDVDSCQDYFSLHYRLAFDKGFLTDWDTEKAVWDRSFQDNVLGVDPTQLSLLVTEPCFNLPKIQDTYDQLVFEEYEFQSYYRAPVTAMIPYGDLLADGGLAPPECMIIVDSGFSFTHVVPILSGSIMWSFVKRIDVGGKLLTNHLKEVISYRHYNLMDQTFIVNEIKEKCCFVSEAFGSDLEVCRNNPRRNTIVQEYVLPDISANRHGYIRPPVADRSGSLSGADADAAVLFIENERFSVPELLFTPSDIGMDQAGIPETIAHCISLLPEDLQGLFWANIGLIGGNTKFPGFARRLMDELRPMAPEEYEVVIYPGTEPITQGYRAAWSMSRTDEFGRRAVTRAEYLEEGSSACRRKFSGQAALGDTGNFATPSTATQGPAAKRSRTRLSGRGRGRQRLGEAGEMQ